MTPSPTDRLDTYRSKRHAARTPEPVPAAAESNTEPGAGDSFVVQEHHARALHWDFRLEHDGVLVSWAVPKGLPLVRGVRRLAVQTEDHPLEYGTFEGDIPDAEYGAGTVTIWDRGRYERLKWSDDEVMIVLHGSRVDGRYVLVRTRGTQWILQRMDPGAEGRERIPELVRPMLATAADVLPADDEHWGFEFKWDGVRAIAYVEGGRCRLFSRNDHDVTVSYPELTAVGQGLGGRDAVLDGEIVAFDAAGRPSFGRLQQRMHITDGARARRLAAEVPAVYLVFDIVFLDGRTCTGLPYRERRGLLDTLDLDDDHVHVPPWFAGGGADVQAAADAQGLEGVVAKRLESAYQPGRRSADWRKVKRVHTQEVVVIGWAPGQGRRHATIGALLLAIPEADGLHYAGRVGTGFTDAVLRDLAERLAPLERAEPPVVDAVPRAQAADARWVAPVLVGEVAFSERTSQGRLRHPTWRGLRVDKPVEDVTPEP